MTLIEVPDECVHTVKECTEQHRARLDEAIAWMEANPGTTQQEAAERAGYSRSGFADAVTKRRTRQNVTNKDPSYENPVSSTELADTRVGPAVCELAKVKGERAREIILRWIAENWHVTITHGPTLVVGQSNTAA